jgi:hypothetical protein
MGTEIEKRLNEAGYRMLGDNESIERLILNILKSKNIRYLKAIPFLIYKHKVDLNKISKSNETNKLFQSIIAITAKLFREFNIAGILPERIEENIEKLDYNEFRDEFELQLRNEAKPSLFIDKQKIYAERDLQMHLSQLFTKKEKQIIRRLLEDKPISRTDYEYYSRKTRKKLSSIIGLQDFAKVLYAKTPKYDMDLYNLKKKLEDKLNGKLQEFFLFDEDKLSISYRNDKEKLLNVIINLSSIKDKELLNLIKKYKKHDFR